MHDLRQVLPTRHRPQRRREPGHSLGRAALARYRTGGLIVLATGIRHSIVRRLADSAELDDLATDIADRLLSLGRRVPPEDWLIVGGSLARGEPTFVRHDQQHVLASDIDFLYVHSGQRPSMPVTELAELAEQYFSTVDLMVLPLSGYRRIQTSLGYDFKNLGVALTDTGLPGHTPVELDPRDAYEILLYYTQAYFWCGLHDSWLNGEDTAQHHLVTNRLCMKILRATAMLDGAYAHHDFKRMPRSIADRMRAELRWRRDPSQPPMAPGRFWTYLAEALARFDTEFGQRRADAVNYSRYATTSSGRIVARHHQAAHQLARTMADAWLVTSDPRALATVKHRAWAEYTGWDGTHIQPSPEDYFRRHKQDIHHHLLAMKVQVV
ncbi:hypothetical protein [Nocardia sp. CA-290969]|uniref:hypothetical protein n=1 Tax=Nocardia sp. CA-290969 TaxID=3239986 RepID=UPI003D8BBA8A